jgi:hypothetical protein
MRYRIECPECAAHDTERVHVEWLIDGVEETRICNECPAQFTNKFGLFDKDVDTVGETA